MTHTMRKKITKDPDQSLIEFPNLIEKKNTTIARKYEMTTKQRIDICVYVKTKKSSLSKLCNINIILAITIINIHKIINIKQQQKQQKKLIISKMYLASIQT